MEISLIEKYDKLRYNTVKWFTVGWTLWFGGFILKDFVINKLVLIFIIITGLIGWIIYAITLIRLIKIGKIINSDSKLKVALNDEFMAHNRNKSFFIGFCSIIILVAIFMILSVFTELKALIVCEITLYVGVLSALVSSLLYNRG